MVRVVARVASDGIGGTVFPADRNGCHHRGCRLVWVGHRSKAVDKSPSVGTIISLGRERGSAPSLVCKGTPPSNINHHPLIARDPMTTTPTINTTLLSRYWKRGTEAAGAYFLRTGSSWAQAGHSRFCFV